MRFAIVLVAIYTGVFILSPQALQRSKLRLRSMLTLIENLTQVSLTSALALKIPPLTAPTFAQANLDAQNRMLRLHVVDVLLPLLNLSRDCHKKQLSERESHQGDLSQHESQQFLLAALRVVVNLTHKNDAGCQAMSCVRPEMVSGLQVVLDLVRMGIAKKSMFDVVR